MGQYEFRKDKTMKRTQQKNGFTIVELLTVMAVIALLIGLLVPALALVKDRAKEIQQRTQFHAISAGLEMFKADFGNYPESNDNAINTASSPQKLADNRPYAGANKLAEAMVGYDYLGFHPNSDFRSDGANTIVNQLGVQVPNTVVYHPDYDVANWETAAQNIQARKGPYVELENASAFRMDEIYTSFPASSGYTAAFSLGGTNQYPMALCDVFARKRGGLGGKKTGTPILYFRARTHFSIQNSDSAPESSIYYFSDNATILDMGMPDTGVAHTLFTGPSNEFVNFDDTILNKNVQAVRRPYKAGSFILWSAGKDGSFGTADDIFNFTKEAE
jgi:prepilin-type N-terminal cleavage/methylation domain-containing protein